MDIKQSNLIKSLKSQPLIVVLRLEKDFFDIPCKKDILLLNIKKLSSFGIKHIEIGWDPNPKWVDLISEIQSNFKHINLGIASITTKKSLSSMLSMDINYSMSPLFNKEVHREAIECNQLVIPGISNLQDFKEAINLGYRIIKIFPASKLGIEFLHKLKEYRRNDIFFIGAGGIKSRDLKNFLNNGYNAIAIGKELPNQIPDKDLEIWFKRFNKDSCI